MATKTNSSALSGNIQPVSKGPAQPLKPAPNKAMPPKPSNPQDVEDIERSDSEGMAQPQDLPPHPVPTEDERREPTNVRQERQ